MPSIPLFPLKTVLFPGGRLALQVFEARYVDMVRACMRDATGFGVVLIREGVEAGGPAETFATGTHARIVDFASLDSGLLGITVQGDRRFRIVAGSVQVDGLQVGEIEWLDEVAAQAQPELESYAALLGHLLPELGDLYAGITPRLDDPDWVVARLFEILPVPLSAKQEALELASPQRFELLRSLVRIKTVAGEDPDAGTLQ